MNPDILQSLQGALQAGSLAAVLSQPWAVCVPSLAQEYMAGRFKLRLGPRLQQDPGAMTWDEYCAEKANARNGMRIYGDVGVAVQPVQGVMYPGASVEDEAFDGVFNTDRITRACDAVAINPAIRTFVFQMHTPGGSVFGLDSAAKAITALQSRRKKDLNCVAWVSHLCASAGMYVAAACDSIHAAPSALVGSIGTISSLTDTKGLWDKLGMVKHVFTADSALKALGMGGVTPSAEHLAHMDARTRQYSGEFKSWMKNRRGLKSEDMQGQYGEARHAPVGMVDSWTFLSMEAMLAAGLGL